MLDRLKDQFEDASRRYAEAKLQEELGELTQVSNKLTGRGRTHGRSEAELRQALADETADMLGHVLLFARANGIDLAAAVERKWRFRPE